MSLQYILVCTLRTAWLTGLITPVRLTSGALAVFSPVALTPDVRSTLQSLGNDVRYITAPDLEHHMFIGQWHKEFPQAKVIGPEGLPEKRAKQKTEQVPFGTVLTQKAKTDVHIGDDFERDFDYEYIGSHPSKEIVLFYRPDRTLIQADLLFNLPATEQYSRAGEAATAGLATRLFGIPMSTAGSAIWNKRFQWYVASAKDRAAFNSSIQRIGKWDFDRIIPCHGDVIETGGKGIFQKIFAWHL